jgi:hypothetical protein
LEKSCDFASCEGLIEAIVMPKVLAISLIVFMTLLVSFAEADFVS